MPFSPKQVLDAYNDYHDGTLGENQRADYERDIDAGGFSLPPGVDLENYRDGLVGPTSPVVLNKETIEAFNAGEMSDEEVEALKADYEAGLITIPEGFELDEPGLWTDFTNWFKESVGGEGRSTPEIESVRNWFVMPEMDMMTWEGAKAALKTIASDPDETVKILKKQFPDMQFKKDYKGNNMMLSAIDGLWYGMQPGMTESDVIRGAGFIGLEAAPQLLLPGGKVKAGTGAVKFAAKQIGKQMGLGVATQTAVETGQAVSGGDFDASQVVMAAGGEVLGGLGAKGLGAAFRSGKRGYLKTAAKAVEGVIEEGAEVGEHLTKTMRKAAQGKEKAIEKLAASVDVDKEMIKVADELGIDVGIGEMSKSKAFREISRTVEESIPGGKITTAKDIARKRTNEIADSFINRDITGTNNKLFNQMSEVQKDLEFNGEALYKELSAKIPPNTPTEATAFVKGIEDRIESFGDKGVQGLTPTEKKLYQILKPSEESGFATYALIDDVRKDINRAIFKNEGPFKEGSKRKLREMASNLLEDQKTISEEFGMGKVFEEARATIVRRMEVQDKMINLFGKDVSNSISGKLDNAIVSVSKGDEKKFVKLMRDVPKEMREEVAMAGLAKAFGTRGIKGEFNPSSYASWYKALKDKPQAYNALMVNLPEDVRQGMGKLYRFSDGINNMSREAIKTGRVVELAKKIEGMNQTMSAVMSFSKRMLIAAPLEAGASYIGAPSGIGLGLTALGASIVTKRSTKEPVMIAAEALLTSPEFKRMVMAGGTQKAASQMARSSVWNKFYKELGKPTELAKPAQWLMGVYHAQRQMKKEEE